MIRDPKLLYPGDLSILPQTTDRAAFRELSKLKVGTVSTADFPLLLTSPVATDVLRFDGTNWVNQSYLPGPFGIGAAAPSSQLLRLSPPASQFGLVVGLAAGASSPALDVRTSANQTLWTVTASGDLTMAGALTVSGATTFGGALAARSLSVSNGAALSGGATIFGGGTVNGGLVVDATGLAVAGGGRFGAAVGVAGSLAVTGGITAGGLLLASTDAAVSGSLSVVGETSLNRNVYLAASGGIGEHPNLGRLQAKDSPNRLIFTGASSLYSGVGGLILERISGIDRVGYTLAQAGVAKWSISLQPITNTLGFWLEPSGYYPFNLQTDGQAQSIIRDSSLNTIVDPMTVRHQTGPAIFPFPIPTAGHGTGIALWGIDGQGNEAQYSILRTVVTVAASGAECNDFYLLNRRNGAIKEAFRHRGATFATDFWGTVGVSGTLTASGAFQVNGPANLGDTVAAGLTASTLTVTGATLLQGPNTLMGATNASGVVTLTLVDGNNGSALYPLVLEHRLAPGVSGSTQTVGIDLYSVDAGGGRARYCFIKTFMNNAASFGTALSFNTFTGGVATENLRLRDSQAWFPNHLQVDGETVLKGNLSAGATTLGTLTVTGATVLGAGTPALAPARFRPGVLLTTPTTGAMEATAQSLAYTPQTTRRYLPLVSDPLTASVALSGNITAETALVTGTVAAQELAVGKVLKLRVLGRYTSAATNTLTLRTKILGQTIHSIVTTAGTQTNAPIDLEFLVTVRTSGAAGTVWCFTTANFNNVLKSATSTATTPVDCGIAQPLTVSGQWSAANTGYTLSIDQAWLEMHG